jgi:hypothetical protein
MKTIKVLVLCIGLLSLTTSVFAQLSVGFRAGVNIANQTFEQDGVEISPDSRLGITAAGLVEIPVSGGFSIQPEIAFVQKGLKFKFDFLGTTEEVETILNHIDVPILAKYNFGSETVGAFVAAGPTFGYAISGKSKANGEEDKFDDGDWEGYKRFEIGASLGAGVGANVGSGMLFLDVRYLLSLTNLAEEEGFTAKNKGISLSVGYKFPLGN